MGVQLAAVAPRVSDGGPFDLVNGLPVHPLVVHAAVVLVPLAALGLLVMVVSPRFSRSLGWLVAAGSVAGAGAAWVAKESGEALQERIGGVGFDHDELGEVMPLFAAGLAVVTIALWLLDRSAPPEGPIARRGLRILTAVLAVVVAVGNLVWVYRVGDSGAKSVWTGKVASTSASDGDVEDGDGDD
jgi:uncharacterized membrane protein